MSKYDKAIAAIDSLHSDFSVEIEECLENLHGIRDHVLNLIE